MLHAVATSEDEKYLWAGVMHCVRQRLWRSFRNIDHIPCETTSTEHERNAYARQTTHLHYSPRTNDEGANSPLRKMFVVQYMEMETTTNDDKIDTLYIPWL
jgi:hypothetical protein